VMLGQYSGTEVKIDGEDLVIVREDEILGTVTIAKAAGKR
jgi:co-chaperonin GroES (HSP10)